MLFRGLHISLPSAFDTGISDGCGTPDLSPARELKVIDQVTVAGVRQMFGFDHSDNALTQFAHAYPGLVALNTTGAT